MRRAARLRKASRMQTRLQRRTRNVVSVAAVVPLLLFAGGCSRDSVTERAEQAAQEVRESLRDPDAPALAQKAPPQTVREVQDALRKLNEYQGETTGELDRVTINAVEAFQRTAGLPDNGMLDQRTLQRLRAAAAR